MAINGISSYSNYQYQNTLNLLRMSSMRNSSLNAVSAINRIGKTTSSSDPYQDVKSFLTKYQSALTSLESSAAKLSGFSKSNAFNDYQVGSTNEDVADVKAGYKLNGDTDIRLQVESLAQSQQNQSGFKVGQETAKAGEDMNFEIETSGGNISVSISALNDNGTAKTYNQMYREAAQAINAQDTGVRAQVVNDGGKVSLSIASRKTGEANGFKVTGSTGAATGIENAAIAAQDAVYTVTENGFSQSYRSDSNEIDLDVGRIHATLKSTGETNIFTGIDTDKVISAVEDLVKDYNSVTNLLSENTGRGVGAAKQYASFGRGLADEKTLKQLGISHDKEGNLVLDKKKLEEALVKEYEGTSQLISGQFGIAEKAAARADAALSSPVQRIASNDLSSISSQTQNGGNYYDSFRYMGNFARSGAYNIGNYYTVGMLLNTLG